MQNAAAATTSNLSCLLGYLEHDPENPNLLADAATAAFDDGSRTSLKCEMPSRMQPEMRCAANGRKGTP